jgi:hypothetical protein
VEQIAVAVPNAERTPDGASRSAAPANLDDSVAALAGRGERAHGFDVDPQAGAAPDRGAFDYVTARQSGSSTVGDVTHNPSRILCYCEGYVILHG